MVKKELKDRLIEIKKNDYKVINEEKSFELSLIMLDNIGDLDSELRDNLIYTTLATWILNDVFTEEQINRILKLVLDEKHIFYKIGEVGDSVFTRTFSVLILPVILYKHRQKKFLLAEDIQIIFKKLIEYLKLEKDLRGYVKAKGWAHAVAHSADALDELAKCEELKYTELIQILNLIKYKITINNYAYVNEEDERMVVAVISILERNVIDEKEIINWIKGFRKIRKTDEMPEDNITHFNTKNFLRSLYFRLYKNENKKLCNHILDILNEISHFK